MIAIRRASTSASSRYCVVRKTVTPSSFASRDTSSQRSARLFGSSPVVGSSRKITCGRCTSASARSSRRFMPPGVLAHAAAGELGQPHARDQLGRPLLPLVLRQALHRALEAHVLPGVEQRVERRLLERDADARPHPGRLARDVVAGDERRTAGWAGAASSACARSSTCRRRSGRGSRRSRRGRRRGRCRRPRGSRPRTPARDPARRCCTPRRPPARSETSLRMSVA